MGVRRGEFTSLRLADSPPGVAGGRVKLGVDGVDDRVNVGRVVMS
jgi:hypothetical protein